VINGGIMHDIFGDDAYEQPPLATYRRAASCGALAAIVRFAPVERSCSSYTLHYAVTGK
jgi:hypothetical protein